MTVSGYVLLPMRTAVGYFLVLDCFSASVWLLVSSTVVA